MNFSVKGSLFPKQQFMSILGVLRVTGVTAQRIHFWTFGFILSSRGHANDVPFLRELCSMSYRFRVINPRSLSTPYSNRSIYTFWAKRVQTTVRKSGLAVEIRL